MLTAHFMSGWCLWIDLGFDVICDAECPHRDNMLWNFKLKLKFKLVAYIVCPVVDGNQKLDSHAESWLVLNIHVAGMNPWSQYQLNDGQKLRNQELEVYAVVPDEIGGEVGTHGDRKSSCITCNATAQ